MENIRGSIGNGLGSTESESLSSSIISNDMILKKHQNCLFLLADSFTFPSSHKSSFPSPTLVPTRVLYTLPLVLKTPYPLLERPSTFFLLPRRHHLPEPFSTHAYTQENSEADWLSFSYPSQLSVHFGRWKRRF
ncbi:unnamed protein product [Citrullus colocynthis]|uniref:Uncharacterized protein n=1 Tax=Citrullus colocynthis TaxID=252529 RepID=A0ABP0YTK6_9ROSI